VLVGFFEFFLFDFVTLIEVTKAYSTGFILYFVLLLIQLIPITRDFDMFYIETDEIISLLHFKDV